MNAILFLWLMLFFYAQILIAYNNSAMLGWGPFLAISVLFTLPTTLMLIFLVRMLIKQYLNIIGYTVYNEEEMGLHKAKDGQHSLIIKYSAIIIIILLLFFLVFGLSMNMLIKVTPEHALP